MFMVTYPELRSFTSYHEIGQEQPEHEENEQGDHEEQDNKDKEKEKVKKDDKKEEHDKERHICDPMCLLYVKNGNLVPLAIQLTQNPTVHTPIYTRWVKDWSCALGTLMKQAGVGSYINAPNRYTCNSAFDKKLNWFSYGQICLKVTCQWLSHWNY